jgi:hypothetical protein
MMSFQTQKQKHSKDSNMENEGVKRITPLHHFLSNDQEALCPERHKHVARSMMVHHLTGKCSHGDMTQSSGPHHNQKSVTSHHRLLKQKKTDNSVSQWSTPYHDLQ